MSAKKPDEREKERAERERAVLGNLIEKADRWLPVVQPMMGDGHAFFWEQHRLIYQAVVNLGPAACLVSLPAHLSRVSTAYLAECVDIGQTLTGEPMMRHIVRLILEEARVRKDEHAAKEFIEGLKQDPHEARSKLITHLTTGQADAQGGEPLIESAAALMEKNLGETRWAIEGIQPEGLTLTAGRPKVGKSWLNLNKAVAIASGGVALGKIRVERGSVLLLALEDSRKRLQKRLRQVLNGEPVPDCLDYAVKWPRLDQGGLEKIEQWILEHTDARLVSIDTLAKIRPPGRPNGNLYAEDYAALAGMKALADKYQIAVDVTLHTRKKEADDYLDTISGTTGLTGAADTTLILERQRGTDEARLHGDGRDLEHPIDLALQWDGPRGLWLILGDAAQCLLTPEQREIVETLEGIGRQAPPAEVAEKIGKKIEAVKSRMWRMQLDGKLTVTTDGRYWPTRSRIHATGATDATHATYETEATGVFQ